MGSKTLTAEERTAYRALAKAAARLREAQEQAERRRQVDSTANRGQQTADNAEVTGQ